MQLLLRRFKLLAITYYPRVQILGLVILSGMPARIFPFGEMMLPIVVGCTCYWTLFKPELLPLWSIAALYLLMDILEGFPLGLSVFLILLLVLSIRAFQKRLVRQGFSLTWVAFSIAITGYYAAMTGLLWAINGQMTPWQGLTLQWGFGIGVYPLVHSWCTHIQRALPAQWGRR